VACGEAFHERRGEFFGLSSVRCDVRLISWSPGKAKKYHNPWRCGAVWCDAQNRRSNPESDHRGLGRHSKKFSERRQSRSTRRETGANRHPAQTRRLMSRQRQIPRWSRRRTRRMSGMGMPWVASCAWKGFVGTRGDRAAPGWRRSPAPPRKLRWVV
jgi:hypothetical protein